MVDSTRYMLYNISIIYSEVIFMLKICEVCGKEYEGKSYSKYCSPECKKVRNSKVASQRRSEKRKQEWG